MMHLWWKEKIISPFFLVQNTIIYDGGFDDGCGDRTKRFKNGDGRNFAYVENYIHTDINTEIFLVWHLRNATQNL